jgi:hypothetical protein
MENKGWHPTRGSAVRSLRYGSMLCLPLLELAKFCFRRRHSARYSDLNGQTLKVTPMFMPLGCSECLGSLVKPGELSQN